MSTPAPLPNPRRYVTSHNAAGQAVVLFNDEVPMISVGGSAGGVAWATEKHPAEVLGDADGAKLSLPGIVHPTGSVLRFIDMPPGASFPIHHTTSLDYGVVLNGEFQLELTDGSFTTLRTGEVVVLRGTQHAWHNKGTEWARFLTVILPSEPVLLNGKAPEGGPLFP